MTPFDAGRFALLWGPGILVLVVFSYAFVRLAYHWIEPVDGGQAPADGERL